MSTLNTQIFQILKNTVSELSTCNSRTLYMFLNYMESSSSNRVHFKYIDLAFYRSSKIPCQTIPFLNGSILVLELHGEQLKQQGWVLLHLAVELLAGQVPCLLPNNLQQHLLKRLLKDFAENKRPTLRI